MLTGIILSFVRGRGDVDIRYPCSKWLPRSFAILPRRATGITGLVIGVAFGCNVWAVLVQLQP
ncbi:hypothetical protein TMES_19055 [Thalassospira mesophila]|uniref:Uncharacterized protein n=1 Tax=Thalassospira mesophila TaxID=1293891 RepID=A0A1Y2KYQ6_9PROT|nr:hypothetical protein TMES_19055 [Thalassospira mesophila]